MKEYNEHIIFNTESLRMNVVQLDLSYKVLEESLHHERLDKK